MQVLRLIINFSMLLLALTPICVSAQTADEYKTFISGGLTIHLKAAEGSSIDPTTCIKVKSTSIHNGDWSYLPVAKNSCGMPVVQFNCVANAITTDGDSKYSPGVPHRSASTDTCDYKAREGLTNFRASSVAFVQPNPSDYVGVTLYSYKSGDVYIVLCAQPETKNKVIVVSNVRYSEGGIEGKCVLYP